MLVDDTGHATLTDFGRAKVIGAVGYDTPILAGYAPYMAPELFPQGDVNIDQLFSQKSDVYAFGMLCFEVSRITKGDANLIYFCRCSLARSHLHATKFV